MKVLWPFGVALRGEMSSRLMLHWLKTVVVSDGEKAACESSGRDQEGERERTVGEASNTRDDIKTEVCVYLRDESGGNPFTGQVVSQGVGKVRGAVRVRHFSWSAAV